MIGISEYDSETIEHLPAAAGDAITFTRCLNNWSAPTSRIHLLLNKEATPQRIQALLQEFQDTPCSDFLFYFCGHGFRTEEPSPKSYLFLSESFLQDYTPQEAIPLEPFVQKLNSLNASNIYICIDACHLRLNSIINPKFEEELQGNIYSEKNCFCLFSSGIHASFEDMRKGYGYFTHALLLALSIIRHEDPSPTHLVRLIHTSMQELGFHPPEMYNLGTQTLQFLVHSHASQLCDNYIVRQKLIATIHDQLIQHRDQILVLIGPHGCGKSTLAAQLACTKTQIFHLPLNLTESDSIQCVNEALFNCDIAPPDGKTRSLQSHLDYLEIHHPHACLIFDSVPYTTSTSLIDILSRSKLRFILLTTQSLTHHLPDPLLQHILEIDIPPLDEHETQLLIENNATHSANGDSSLVHLISKGHPEKVQRALLNYHNSTPSQEDLSAISDTISALYSCGLYINEDLFVSLFKLQSHTLTFLEEAGLLLQEGDCRVPHELLITIAETEALTIDGTKARDYWECQLKELPNNLDAAHSFVTCLICFGYDPRLDTLMKVALQTIYEQHHSPTEILSLIAPIFIQKEFLTPASLQLATYLIQTKQFDLAQDLLHQKSDTTALNQKARTIEAHLLWRSGDCARCITLCTSQLHALTMSSEKLWFHFHRGIAYYFSGYWHEAEDDFSIIHTHAEQPKYIAWARCMLGTITGLRGVSLQKSKHLIKSGVQMLLQHKDLDGVWVGWNNLGEILWKSGELRPAAFYLQKALHISEKTMNQSMTVETLRNMVHLSMRTSSPFSKEMSNYLTTLEQSVESCEPLERMQIYNTLGTAYLFRHDLTRSIKYIKHALTLTTHNQEYHIYSLANLALLFKYLHHKEKSDSIIQRAIALATTGHNQLAIRQIQHDYTHCPQRQ